MQGPVEQGHGEHGVGEDLVPLVVALVRVGDRALAGGVALVDGFEEEASVMAVQRLEAEVGEPFGATVVKLAADLDMALRSASPNSEYGGCSCHVSTSVGAASPMPAARAACSLRTSSSTSSGRRAGS